MNIQCHFFTFSAAKTVRTEVFHTITILYTLYTTVGICIKNREKFPTLFNRCAFEYKYFKSHHEKCIICYIQLWFGLLWFDAETGEQRR